LEEQRRADKKFKELNEAYTVLNDADEKRRYDLIYSFR
jgi:DnaJ-class molecular chaperone